ncbi:uncharacterized protein [Chelonus insularis]|uniref:uncharacterized protein n=1 Tax=Chelonus insularis TaxID=460826 RepID=UPI001589BF65|nr:uncharacterized protein LOC118066362 [Chelonus insularis]
MVKIIFFLIVTVFVSANAGGLSIPGTDLHFKLLTANVTGTPNEYLEHAAITIHPDGYTCDVNTVIVKQYPTNVMLNVTITYAGMEMPPMNLEACIAFYEQWFVKGVIEKGTPKEKFPHNCPIDPGNYTVMNYEVPKEKIPPGTPPGAVDVFVTIYIPDGSTIMHLHVTGVLEAGASGTPQLPLGK